MRSSLMPERRFLYNFRSLPETFGRIEVMELWLLLAYPWAVPEKAVAGLNLAAAFYLLGRDLALFGTFLCNSNEPMTKVSNAKSMRTRPSAAQSLSDTANHLLRFWQVMRLHWTKQKELRMTPLKKAATFVMGTARAGK